MVEQLTFNQLVVGSIPTPLTNKIKHLGVKLAAFGAVFYAGVTLRVTAAKKRRPGVR